MFKTSVLVIAALLAPAHLAAQSASPYIPLDDRLMPYVEHLIRAGVIADPDPLTRPLRQGAVESALRKADTVKASPGVRATIHRVLEALTPRQPEAYFPMDFYAGGSAGTQSGRDPLHEKGPHYAAPRFGWNLGAVFGPAVISHSTILDHRIMIDPDYSGRTDTTINLPGFISGYLSVQGRYGELFLGGIQRNWGVPGISGDLVSPETYPYDHIMGRLGVKNARVEGLFMELDDYQSPSGPGLRRYWATHRIFLRPWPWLTLAITQASLWYGEGRGIEIKWLNPLRFSAITRQNDRTSDSLNSAHGGQARIELPHHIVLQGGLLIDDLAGFPLIGTSATPTRAVLTLEGEGPVSPAIAVRGFYTVVTSLTYRAPEGQADAIMLRGVGLGRNYADYDQFTFTASVIAKPMLVLTPEITLLRQGEGDFRKPYPNSGQWATWPALFEGVMERTLRVGSGATYQFGQNFDVMANAGVHFIANHNHISGQSDTRFVGGLTVTYHFRRQLPLP